MIAKKFPVFIRDFNKPLSCSLPQSLMSHTVVNISIWVKQDQYPIIH